MISLYEKPNEGIRIREHAQFPYFCENERSHVQRAPVLGRSKDRERKIFFRTAIEPGLRLAITLRYLVTGDSYKSLPYSFFVAHNTIVPETYEAIIQEYLEEDLSSPRIPGQ